MNNHTTEQDEPDPMRDQGNATGMSQLSIGIDVYLTGLQIPAEQVKLWLEGAIVALPDLDGSENLRVELRNAGKRIARGQLVRLDDGYGVLIDSVDFTKGASRA